jgi:hypothetical protein
MDIENKYKLLIDPLSPGIWLHVFKSLNEQSFENLIFAYPKFQLLKIAWKHYFVFLMHNFFFSAY